jgi:translation initiation factor 2D
VSGTVYVGSHPGEEERILWFQLGPSDQRLYPTVYTLWHNPGVVPLLYTQGFVVEKLQKGADLMTPGLTRGPPFPVKAKKNTIVAVASIEKSSVPAFVGVCEVDVSALEKVQGAKGHAVKGVHWEGDELWAWGYAGTGGRKSPEHVDGWDDLSSVAGLGKGVKNMAIEEDDVDGQDEGGVSLEEPPSQKSHKERVSEAPNELEEEETAEPSTEEVDQVFYNAFLYALYNARKNGSSPHYGIDLPVNPSLLISNLVQPYLPIKSATQAQYYTLKKTSWKNTKKFIKHLDKKGLVKSKDRNGGETVIFDIDFDDQQIRNFTPYRLPKPGEDKGGSANTQTPSNAGNKSSSDPSLDQTLTLQVLIRPSSKLVPDLLPSKTEFYTPIQVSSFLRIYIDQNSELTTQSSSPRFLKLNPFLANDILGSSGGSNSSTQAADAKALAVGEIARDILQKRILEDTHLCQPYWVLLHGDQKWSSENSSLPKPKSGAPPKLSIIIEKRTGTKTVTKVGNLEAFAINPEILAGELQKKCASSTSVGQLIGGKPGQMEVLVQGDQREVVEKEVGKRGVDRRWIEVMDKTKKKGKK